MRYFVVGFIASLIAAGAASAQEPAPEREAGSQSAAEPRPAEPRPALVIGGGGLPGPDAVIESRSPNISISLADGNLSFDNGSVRVVIRSSPGGFRPQFYARDAGGLWRMILRAGRQGEEIATAWAWGGAPSPLGYASAQIVRNTADGVDVTLGASWNQQQVTTTISLPAASPHVHITVENALKGRRFVQQMLSSLAFDPGEADPPVEGEKPPEDKRPDFTWAPRLRPQKHDVIGDTAFGSPALIVQKGPCLAALVADVSMLRTNRRMKASLSLDASSALTWLCYGFLDYAPRGEIAHHHQPTMAQELANTTLRYGFYLLLSAQAPPRAGYRAVADFLWKNLPKPDHVAQVALQQKTLSDWCANLCDGVARLVEAPELQFNDSGQHVALAYALALRGREDDRLMQNAAELVKLLTDGQGASRPVFPAAINPADPAQPPPTPPGTPENCFSTSLSSNTGRWLLRWHEAFAGDDDAILQRCKAYADLLLHVQLPSGCVPAWLSADDLLPLEGPLYDRGSASAESAAFFAALYGATNEECYAVGAMAALQFIQYEVLPAGRWVDHRSRRAPDDPFSGQYPQSISSMISAAQGCAAIYRHTGKKRYLALGEEVVGYLALYQDAWGCQWAGTPFGSLPSLNFGESISPALQAEAAAAFCEYFALNGRIILLERGVAALRAALAGLAGDHDDRLASAAVLSLARRIRSSLGDAVIDAASGQGRGINACTISNLIADERSVNFDLISPMTWAQPALVRFLRCDRTKEVIVNGKWLGVLTPAELTEGVQCAPRLPLTIDFTPVIRSLAGVEPEIAVRVHGGTVKPEVFLLCRRQGAAEFAKVPMTAGGENEYAARIPAALVAEKGVVEYSIAAASGTETAVRPTAEHPVDAYSLSLTPDLTLNCGVDDMSYIDDEITTSTLLPDGGRQLGSLSSCFYFIPLPNDTQAVRLEVDMEGDCEVYAADTKLAQAGLTDDAARKYTADDPALWPTRVLRLRIQVPVGAAAVLRRIRLIPVREKK